MDLIEQLKVQIPQQERNQALIDALETQNPILIEFALEIGADPIEGGGELLVYASQKGDVELTKKLLTGINLIQNEDYLKEAATQAAGANHREILETLFAFEKKSIIDDAVCAAVINNQVTMAIWLLEEGATIHITQDSIKEHIDTINQVLTQIPEVKANIEYGALFQMIYTKDSAEILESLLKALKKNTSPEKYTQMLVELGEDAVETERIDCIQVMMRHGLNLAYVRTKYCYNQKMREFLKANGAIMFK
jgi:hypothetical protein